MELASLTPEGKIVSALNHGKHTFKELKVETGLSDRWLAVKLKELEDAGVVEKRGRWYSLARKPDLSSYELSLYMNFMAGRVAAELAKLPPVKTVILFGGVAQRNADELSDLDMIIVVDKPVGEVEGEILSEISKLEATYHMVIGPLILGKDDFLDNVYSYEGGIVYGLAMGFKVLIDKTGELAAKLSKRVEEIRRHYEYLRDVGVWLKAG
ncbi:MAG: nucleotidyltransferase domain-containing protein [Candidatus Bathyarchaeia archaeon]